MDIVTLLHQFADNWMLLAMVGGFTGAVVWAFRPGASAVHRDTSMIPFRNETAPKRDEMELGS